MKYIGLVGKKSSGKDTAYDALKAHFGKAVARLSFADELKRELCEQLRADVDLLNANKNLPPFRQLLQNYGVWRRSQHEDYWLLRAETVAFHPAVKLVVVTDCRFLNEAAWVRKNGGDLVRIVRPSLLALDTHSSEIEQDAIQVDYTICNDQTIVRLEKLMVDYVKNYAKLI
tara:strand:+ start:6478 stop:6993 length:516 start_codon:yes stop_codon:yes gene_type:complete